MSSRARFSLAAILAIALVVSAGCVPPSVGSERGLESLAVDDAFWSHWGDGRAEVATYDLVVPRYGEPRRGTAVAVFVTEPFLESARVKADHPAKSDDSFQVVKLNLVKDFQTGVYDYNTMLSAFVSLEDVAGRPAGTPAKLSFSSQEWCGHVYHQVLFDRDGLRETLHSYFEGEADRDGRLPRPADGIAEDALYLWARGLAAPALAPGESRNVSVLRSLQDARFAHRDLDWSEATLSRTERPSTVEVPAGSFEADRYTVEIEGGGRWTFDVERAAPHRLLRWERSGGERAELVAVDRMPYWSLLGNSDVEALERIGLTPRPPRTP
jgi:hypothetical protein